MTAEEILKNPNVRLLQMYHEGSNVYGRSNLPWHADITMCDDKTFKTAGVSINQCLDMIGRWLERNS